eukprot:CAMPEP_0184539874 /NCGR_PEP_ID=MMETSP0198_2-20121128/18355_1 /TAXON_ID=1112570 /ORGANISM="Thraustochytrium sp., Strain LLF1b" /LENGTH=105 /DNA_ID=CAMNT_0026933411 /DNA_START=206 /DNA_END=520 /DNA_ORIENTATION=-
MHHGYAIYGLLLLIVVTADRETQRPDWLSSTASHITLVEHSEIFPEWAKAKGALPTFNSCAIESVLHRIPGLAECYLYLNDDVLFLKPLYLHDFWSPELHAPYAW